MTARAEVAHRVPSGPNPEGKEMSTPMQQPTYGSLPSLAHYAEGPVRSDCTSESGGRIVIAPSTTSAPIPVIFVVVPSHAGASAAWRAVTGQPPNVKYSTPYFTQDVSRRRHPLSEGPCTSFLMERSYVVIAPACFRLRNILAGCWQCL